MQMMRMQIVPLDEPPLDPELEWPPDELLDDELLDWPPDELLAELPDEPSPDELPLLEPELPDELLSTVPDELVEDAAPEELLEDTAPDEELDDDAAPEELLEAPAPEEAPAAVASSPDGVSASLPGVASSAEASSVEAASALSVGAVASLPAPAAASPFGSISLSVEVDAGFAAPPSVPGENPPRSPMSAQAGASTARLRTTHAMERRADLPTAISPRTIPSTYHEGHQPRRRGPSIRSRSDYVRSAGGRSFSLSASHTNRRTWR
jgi:hypothetical protein